MTGQRPNATGLRQHRLSAECDLTDAQLRLGHGDDLVARLTARAMRWPLDERVSAQFMLPLHRAGAPPTPWLTTVHCAPETHSSAAAPWICRCG